MSVIGTYGLSDQAPEYHCSVMGTPKWSGLKAEAFTPELVKELKHFIANTAHRRGHNDAISGDYHPDDKTFHPEFLGGWPAEHWTRYYKLGYKSQMHRNKN
ncbi:hypothetical protein [Photobacterium leiognathi]|uniref:hypothetical protein n=1 Tax=Photobacterium leiognathi TaxID=553611 RepID=UPI002982175A|nr:hypothetical protein [Photobacterium leiognathi]